MTSKDAIDSIENDSLSFGAVGPDGKVSDRGKLGERMVYLYMRYHADRKGVLRMPITEIAQRLETSRRTINDHAESLLKKRLITREGHGRYRVHAEPWSARDIARKHLQSLAPGGAWDLSAIEMEAYAEDLDPADPRFEELVTYEDKLVAAGFLERDEYSGNVTRTRKPIKA